MLALPGELRARLGRGLSAALTPFTAPVAIEIFVATFARRLASLDPICVLLTAVHFLALGCDETAI